MTKKAEKEQERQTAITELRKRLQPGDTVYCILRHRSSSGMSRIIDLVIADGKAVESIAWLAARAMDDRMVNDKHYGIKVSGCGMDMGFHLVYNLGRTLFPDGVPCCGAKCRSNDHSNGDRDYRVSPEHVHHDGGYAFNSKWL